MRNGYAEYARHINGNWENWLNPRHTHRMYLTSISEVQCLQMGLHNYDNGVEWCAITNTSIGSLCTRLFAHIIKLHCDKRNKTQPSRDNYLTAYDGTTTSGTQPRRNMSIMGKVDTSDLMMIIRWFINLSSRSPKLEWASLTHTTSHIANA